LIPNDAKPVYLDLNRLIVQQGDQIGRIFAYWAVVHIGLLFEKITQTVQTIGLLLQCKLCTYFDKNTFWAILSQIHLFTLMSNDARQV
jgi:hypothetical protein